MWLRKIYIIAWSWRVLFYILEKIRKFLAMWSDEQLRVLIDNCKEYNKNYYELVGNEKRIFWKRVFTKINLKFGTSYSGAHCKEKFEGLKRDYKVNENFFFSHSIKKYMSRII